LGPAYRFIGSVYYHHGRIMAASADSLHFSLFSSSALEISTYREGKMGTWFDSSFSLWVAYFSSHKGKINITRDNNTHPNRDGKFISVPLNECQLWKLESTMR